MQSLTIRFIVFFLYLYLSMPFYLFSFQMVTIYVYILSLSVYPSVGQKSIHLQQQGDVCL